jgi:hypothetical protein
MKQTSLENQSEKMYDMYQHYIAKSDPFIVMVSTPTLLMVCLYSIFRRGQHLM